MATTASLAFPLRLLFLLPGWSQAGRAGELGAAGPNPPGKGRGVGGTAVDGSGFRRGETCVISQDCALPQFPSVAPFSLFCCLRRPLASQARKVSKKVEKENAHSLWCTFTIIHLPRPGQQWCEVQVHVDQKNFLFYDCGTDKVLSVGRLEEQLNATDGWGRQLEMLREVGQTLRLELAGTELEDFIPSGTVTLQAKMSCECEADGHSKASWEFSVNGQKFLLFDSHSGKWTVVHPGAKRMKEKWEEDTELTAHLKMVSVRDCRSWLGDFLMRREKTQEPTAPPTVSSGTAQLRATATT
ncbi:UL16-binding protein 3-like, partial [Cebus imitator]|uniref:UL16-binding protein 3-like n=1 Tax=Cebus imitator TaxID=2715852 RepID=UPI000809F602